MNTQAGKGDKLRKGANIKAYREAEIWNILEANARRKNFEKEKHKKRNDKKIY